ncbi:hypothetical protein T484DRAFT_1757025 [Baffinella frigidus]|nr:hypothetical protein T484DRAFT_1757025 [Cryptophyta sp. CCMP2293]
MLGVASSKKLQTAHIAGGSAWGMSGGKAQVDPDSSDDNYPEEPPSKKPALSLENRLAKSHDQLRRANERSRSLRTEAASLRMEITALAETVTELKNAHSVDQKAGKVAGSDLLRDPRDNERQMQRKNAELQVAVQAKNIERKDAELLQLRASSKQHIATIAAQVKEIERKNTEVVQQAAKLRMKQNDINARDKTITAKQEVLSAKTKEILAKDKDIEKKQKQLTCMSNIINGRVAGGSSAAILTDGCSAAVLANVDGLKHRNLELEQTVRTLQSKLHESQALVTSLNLASRLQCQQNTSFSSALRHETEVVQAHSATIARLQSRFPCT